MKKSACLLLLLCVMLLVPASVGNGIELIPDPPSVLWAEEDIVRVYVTAADVVLRATVVDTYKIEGDFPRELHPFASWYKGTETALVLDVKEVYAGYSPKRIIAYFISRNDIDNSNTILEVPKVGSEHIFFLPLKTLDISPQLPVFWAFARPGSSGHQNIFAIVHGKVIDVRSKPMTVAALKKEVRQYSSYLGSYPDGGVWPPKYYLSVEDMAKDADIVAKVRVKGVEQKDGFVSASLEPLEAYKTNGDFDFSAAVNLPDGVKAGDEGYVFLRKHSDGKYYMSEYDLAYAKASSKQGKAVKKALDKGIEYSPYGKVKSVVFAGNNGIGGPITKDIEGIRCRMVEMLNGQIFSEYTYASVGDAELELSRLSRDGNIYSRIMPDGMEADSISCYGDIVNIFARENVLIMYVGHDKQALNLLTKHYGPIAKGGK